MVDDGDEIKRRLIGAQADLKEQRAALLRQMESIYNNPRAAYQNMIPYRRSHGEQGLLSQLEKDPAKFGGTRGHIGSGNALTLQGMRDRKVVKELTPGLKQAMAACLAAENKVRDLEAAYLGKLGPGRGGPDRGSGPDFG